MKHDMPIYVAPATEANIATVMQIERTPGYPELVGTYEEAEHRRRFALENSQYLLCMMGAEAVGFAVLRRDGDAMGNVQLHRIAIAPAGKGLGTAFLSIICDRVFSSADTGRFWLDLLPENQRAQRLYSKLGFAEEGVMCSALRLPDGSRRDLKLMALTREGWKRSGH